VKAAQVPRGHRRLATRAQRPTSRPSTTSAWRATASRRKAPMTHRHAPVSHPKSHGARGGRWNLAAHGGSLSGGAAEARGPPLPRLAHRLHQSRRGRRAAVAGRSPTPAPRAAGAAPHRQLTPHVATPEGPTGSIAPEARSFGNDDREPSPAAIRSSLFPMTAPAITLAPLRNLAPKGGRA